MRLICICTNWLKCFNPLITCTAWVKFLFFNFSSISNCFFYTLIGYSYKVPWLVICSTWSRTSNLNCFLNYCKINTSFWEVTNSVPLSIYSLKLSNEDIISKSDIETLSGSGSFWYLRFFLINILILSYNFSFFIWEFCPKAVLWNLSDYSNSVNNILLI